jgi:AraC-like DNA-binding protein
MENANISLFLNNQRTSWLNVQRYYAMNHASFDMDPHSHKELEIMYSVHGKCHVLCWSANEIYKEYILKEGEYIFIDCNVPHKLVVERGSPCRVLNLEIALTPSKSSISKDALATRDTLFNMEAPFTIDALFTLNTLLHQSQSFELFLNAPERCYKMNDNEGSLHTLIASLQKQLKNPMDMKESQIEVNLLLAQFLIELSRQRFTYQGKKSGNIYVQRTLSYCEENYDSNITVEEIAAAVGISSAHLQRLFKEATASTLIEKINQLRIEKAKLLLETSILPVVDIAINVGFNNRQHFTHTFIKLTGCSPAIYRKYKGNSSLWEGF